MKGIRREREKKMFEGQSKELSQEPTEGKTEYLMDAEQSAEETYLSDVAEKAVKGTSPCKIQLSKKKKLSILAVVAVILAALGVGLGIYNMSANRLARQLDLGAVSGRPEL